MKNERKISMSEMVASMKNLDGFEYRLLMECVEENGEEAEAEATLSQEMQDRDDLPEMDDDDERMLVAVRVRAVRAVAIEILRDKIRTIESRD